MSIEEKPLGHRPYTDITSSLFYVLQFFTFLLVIIILEIVAGSLGYIYKEKVTIRRYILQILQLRELINKKKIGMKINMGMNFLYTNQLLVLKACFNLFYSKQ